MRPTAVSRLLTLVHEEGTISRAAATTRLALTRAAVGDAVSWLTATRILKASPDDTQTGRGRPSLRLAPSSSGPIVASAHLRPGRVEIVLSELGGRPIDKRYLSHIRPTSSPATVFHRLGGTIGDALTETGRNCVGVVVGMAGMTRDHGVVRNAVHFGWDEVAAVQLLGEVLPATPVIRVENDSALTALAEYRRGAARHATSVLVLACEHLGIGGALLGDDVHRSGAGRPLEAGHLSIDRRGVRCPCGQRGCLERYADGQAILDAVGVNDPTDSAQLSRVLGAATRGIAPETAAVDEAARSLGIGLSSLINVLTPNRVVLSGVLGELLRVRGDRIREQIADSVVARTDATEIREGLVADPVLVGGTELAFEPFLAQPQSFVS